MPKMKTHRGAAKRFKKTGTGKIVRYHAYKSHILEKNRQSANVSFANRLSCIRLMLSVLNV